jgi:hypothetical protein
MIRELVMKIAAENPLWGAPRRVIRIRDRQDPTQSVCRAKPRTFHRACQHRQLLTEREIFQRGPVPAADQSDRSEEHHQRREHA